MAEQLVLPAEVRSAVEGASVQVITDEAASFACQLATALTCGYVRLPSDFGVPARLYPIALALAVRIATNPAQYRRMSVDVEGTSFSATYAPAQFNLAEQMVLNRYRQRTA